MKLEICSIKASTMLDTRKNLKPRLWYLILMFSLFLSSYFTLFIRVPTFPDWQNSLTFPVSSKFPDWKMSSHFSRFSSSSGNPVYSLKPNWRLFVCFVIKHLFRAPFPYNLTLDTLGNFPISFSQDNNLKEVKICEYFVAVLPSVTDDFDTTFPTTIDHFCWRFAWLLEEGISGDSQRCLQASVISIHIH